MKGQGVVTVSITHVAEPKNETLADDLPNPEPTVEPPSPKHVTWQETSKFPLTSSHPELVDGNPVAPTAPRHTLLPSTSALGNPTHFQIAAASESLAVALISEQTQIEKQVQDLTGQIVLEPGRAPIESGSFATVYVGRLQEKLVRSRNYVCQGV